MKRRYCDQSKKEFCWCQQNNENQSTTLPLAGSKPAHTWICSQKENYMDPGRD
jgi:hypothetical protein